MATSKTKSSTGNRKSAASSTTKAKAKRKKISKANLKKLLAGAAWGHMFGKDPRTVPRFYGGPQEIARSPRPGGGRTRGRTEGGGGGSSSPSGANRGRGGKGKTAI